jgi:hypothetical protein
MLPKFTECSVYAPMPPFSGDRGLWPSNIAFKVIAATVPLLVLLFASGHTVVSELVSSAPHGKAFQTSYVVPPGHAFDDFAFGYLEFEWEPGQVPGFGPIHKTPSSDAISELRLTRSED